MFERFTDRARRVVVLAQEESRGFSHGYIGTEHLLLGLIHEGEGIASNVLRGLGFTLEGVRDEVTNRVGPGTEAPAGHMPFTPRAKKVLELALRQAIKLEHDYIGTEHILLGVIEEGEGVAALIMLASIEGGLDRVKEAVMAQLVTTGAISRGQRFQAEMRTRMARGQSAMPIAAPDEITARLEAIEARLSVIERLLREQRGEQTG